MTTDMSAAVQPQSVGGTDTQPQAEVWTSLLPVPDMGGVEGPPTDLSPGDVVGGPESGSGDPRWTRPALVGLLAMTAILYLWDLGASGWANAYYSAAVQAASESWKAFFFGSFDSSNFITVDKPPASLWVMAMSARVFGVNSWAILVPQALMGVASVAILYLAVRRWHGAIAGLLAGLVLALTPVAALMFRFNNPDALLVLLLTAAAYATVRAVEATSSKWLVAAGVLVGFGFLTKMMQAFILIPVFAGVYLLAADTPVRRRLAAVVAFGVATIVSAGWWVAIVELWPKDSRPYIGGSQSNSVLELIFGYNGFGRITGNETGSVVPGGGGNGAGGRWGETGLFRLFNASYGGQISWLIPAALILMGGVLWATRRAPRTDRLRASTLLWGGWLILTGLVISFAAGIIHEYYTVALAPGIGALLGIGSVVMWSHRSALWARLVLASALAVTAVWATVLLGRSSQFHSWLIPIVLVGGLVTSVGIVFLDRIGGWGARGRRVALGLAGAGIVLALAGPTAYALQTVSTPHTGSLPTAGPVVAGSRGGFGGGMGPGGTGGGQGQFPGFGNGTQNGQGNQGFGNGNGPGFPGGGMGFGNGQGNQGFGNGQGNQGQGGRNGQGFPGGGNVMGRGGGGTGGLLSAGTPSDEAVAALTKDADSYTWVAATVGANSAAGFQLASGEPIMAIGGFNGSDPAPTLEQFQEYVAQGKIHYFISGGMGGGGRGQNGGSSVSSEIVAWVTENFTATTVGGTTMYDLTQGAGGTAA